VRLRVLSELADLEGAYALFDEIWRPAPENPPITTELMRALSASGNYVAGAFEGGRMVGASVGFFGPPPERTLHSHIAGVAASARGRGVGRALKQHQREWSLERGVEHITWTFDPLVRRNAWFNLARLGARPVAYLPNFYGGMDDAINAGDESDRLLVQWDLGESTDALRAASGRTVHVEVPDDIEELRRRHPGRAREWRLAVRESLGGAMAAGAQVVGFDRDGGYVVETREDSA
jgi:predicted GNAT superfamily acetyltransferase